MESTGEGGLGTGETLPVGKDWLTSISIASALLAAVMLAAMTNFPAFFLTGILTGLVAAAADFVIEYRGIVRGEWRYASSRVTLLGVPMQLPVLFFSTGVAVVFLLDVYVQPMFDPGYLTLSGSPLGFVQGLLFALGACFLALYLGGRVKAITLGMLPVSLAVYLWRPEPWFLVLSLVPVYLDYFLERRMTQTREIRYDGYTPEMAEVVALSYFPMALLLLSLALLLHDWLGGILG